MAINLMVGKEIAGGYKVRKTRNKPIISRLSNPIIEATIIELESSYENMAFLEFYTFLEYLPPIIEWTPIVAEDLEGAEIFSMWKPYQIKQECVCLPYKVRSPRGNLIAVTQMLSGKNKTVVSAKVLWEGFPGINRIFVGFKPGMKMRTEDLLIAGMAIAE